MPTTNDQRPTIDEIEIPDLLANLVERSLVVFDDVTGRYQMPETMRAFATEQLGDEHSEIKRRHFHYFLECAALIRIEQTAGHERGVRRLLDNEADNIRLAIEWGLANDATRTLKLVANIGGSWFRFQPTESARLLQAALAAAPEANDSDHVHAETTLAQALMRTMAEPSLAEQYLNRSLQRLESFEAPNLKALVLLRLSVVARMRGDSEKGLELATASLEMARQAGSADLIARTCMHLGEHARGEGNFSEAIRYYEEAMKQPTASTIFRDFANMNLGSTALQQNDLESAERYYRAAIAISLNAGTSAFEWYSRDGLGYVFMKRGDFRRGGLLMGYGINRRLGRGVSLTLEDAKLEGEMLAYGRENGGEEFENALKDGALINEDQVMELIRE